MTARKRSGGWYFRKWIRHADGTKERVFGTPRRFSLPNSRAGAEEAERRAVNFALEGKRYELQKAPEPELAMTLEAFVPTFIAHSLTKNKPRSVDSKQQILRDHIVPKLGALPLDKVTYAQIEDFKNALLNHPDDPKSPKTVNNILTVVRRLLVVAAKRQLIASVPQVEWCVIPEDPPFDFLTFTEADSLVAGADDGEWRTMVDVALRTGMRQGELLALRWEDVDLKAHRVTVRRQVSRGIITKPKGNRSREIELGDDVTRALAAHRHLRGELVFCDMDGVMLTAGACKHPLYRAARRAKLRRIGWHVLRHTFASHLAMLGASPKSIQELMGHTEMSQTMRYMHLSPATKRETAKLLDRTTAQKVPDRAQ